MKQHEAVFVCYFIVTRSYERNKTGIATNVAPGNTTSNKKLRNPSGRSRGSTDQSRQWTIPTARKESNRPLENGQRKLAEKVTHRCNMNWGKAIHPPEPSLYLILDPVALQLIWSGTTKGVQRCWVSECHSGPAVCGRGSTGDADMICFNSNRGVHSKRQTSQAFRTPWEIDSTSLPSQAPARST